MKLLLVSMLFMIIVSGLLALQIKANYAYRTALMLYTSQQHNFLLESLLILAIKHIKNTDKKSYAFQETIHHDEYDGLVTLEMNEGYGSIYSQLNMQARMVKAENYTCTKNIKNGYSSITISQ